MLAGSRSQTFRSLSLTPSRHYLTGLCPVTPPRLPDYRHRTSCSVPSSAGHSEECLRFAQPWATALSAASGALRLPRGRCCRLRLLNRGVTSSQAAHSRLLQPLCSAAPAAPVRSFRYPPGPLARTSRQLDAAGSVTLGGAFRVVPATFILNRSASVASRCGWCFSGWSVSSGNSAAGRTTRF